ncbi:MAG: DUF1987 domain-containing protein [Bacteroidota bacterium]|nr:DUF1987 domain-containing protein [Bacteroidota bacterium]MDP4226417.1 DUF1987 domain-containing protein [Bacteroidota bacterium]MDP4275733.1 DUF1987 domain-containing protein [Bacteroidota bacterium]
MQDLIIEKTNNFPSVHFSPSTGILKFEGRSIPEDAVKFYSPLLEWIKEYFKNPSDKTRFDIHLEYVNSGSSKFLWSILKYAEISQKKGKDVIVDWFYDEDDEALLELGEQIKSSIELPFHIIEIN